MRPASRYLAEHAAWMNSDVLMKEAVPPLHLRFR